MRKSILVSSLVLVCLTAKAQNSEEQFDRMVSLLGDTTLITVTKVGTDDITFTKKGSQIPFSKAKEDIANIIFSSGEILELNKIAQAGSWESIILTEDKKDVKDLEYVEDIAVRQSILISGKGKDSHDTVMIKAKEKVSETGGRVLLITKNKMVHYPTSMWVIKGEVYK